jgi:pimeloyl-ACP methyl ester carboxylesterase
MARQHTEEIVVAETDDGLRLAGALIRLVEAPAKPIAIVWIHGFNASFYLPLTQLVAGRDLAGRGYTFLSGNTRGHDVGAIIERTEGEWPLGGGAWERFDESPRDIAACFDYVAALGFKKVVLVGLSFGAHKVVYYQAHRQDSRVHGLVAAQPAGQALMASTMLPSPDEASLARRLVAEGRGEELLAHWGVMPSWGRLSAQTTLHRADAGLDVLFDVEMDSPSIAAVRCPLLAFYGTDEEWVGTAEDLEQIRRNARSAPRVDTHLIEGCGHGFWGHEQDVAALVASWVETLV